jgi:hypothetical protein
MGSGIYRTHADYTDTIPRIMRSALRCPGEGLRNGKVLGGAERGGALRTYGSEMVETKILQNLWSRVPSVRCALVYRRRGLPRHFRDHVKVPLTAGSLVQNTRAVPLSSYPFSRACCGFLCFLYAPSRTAQRSVCVIRLDPFQPA